MPTGSLHLTISELAREGYTCTGISGVRKSTACESNGYYECRMAKSSVNRKEDAHVTPIRSLVRP